jgi:hypothetical protein
MTIEYPIGLIGSVTERFHDFPGVETLVRRDDAPKQRFALVDEMLVERGTKADWDLLHDLHYKAEKLPIGPRFWKLTIRGETIGVLVTGSPKGLLRERHLAFPNLKPGAGETRLTNTNRYHFINQNFRVISRFVIDTRFRGIGAGYRMMNLVSRMSGEKFMEIQSSMSKFNAFGQKAGFSFVKPMNANKFDAVMKFFRTHFKSNPADFEAILQEATSRTPEQQKELFNTCRDFYARNSALENTTTGFFDAEKRFEGASMRWIIKGIQQVGLASPLYGVRKNPDHGRTDIPECLPLTAFDRQKPNERLVL